MDRAQLIDTGGPTDKVTGIQKRTREKKRPRYKSLERQRRTVV